jgi:hypothetical protein
VTGGDLLTSLWLLTAPISFGLSLAPLGYLAYKSGWFPRALGILLGIASVACLVDMLAAFLLPDLDNAVYLFASIVPAVTEPELDNRVNR